MDPYWQWLAIPPEDQPPDYYRLLGLPCFSADPQAIAHAAERRLEQLRAIQPGAAAGQLQALTDEVLAARDCLENPETKRAYDAGLRAQARRPPVLPTPAIAALGPDWREPPLLAPPLAAPPVTALPPAPPAAERSPIGQSPDELEPDEEEDDQPPLVAWLLVLTVVFLALLASGTWAVMRKLPRSRTQETPAPVRPPANSPQDRAAATPELEGLVLLPEADGTFNFRAETATLHGENLVRELRGAEPVVANWRTVDDWLSWDFRVVRPGFFQVEVVYAAEDAMAGGRYTLACDGQESTRTVASTGGPGQIGREVFYLAITRSGRQTLELRPVEVAEAGLMALYAVRLIPAGRRQEPEE